MAITRGRRECNLWGRAEFVPGFHLATWGGTGGPLGTLGWPLLGHCSPWRMCEWGPGRHQVNHAVPGSGLL